MKKRIVFILMILTIILSSCNNAKIVIKVEKKEPTCVESGNECYYFEESTNEYYLDKECKTKVDTIPTIPALGHTLTKVEYKEATCTETGNEEYYICDRCKKLFSNSDGTIEIDDIPVIPALGHNLKKVECKEPTCIESGNEEYYICDRCNELFGDSNGKDALSQIQMINPTGHLFTNDYYYDKDYHWKECICNHDIEIVKEAHQFEDDECTICKYKLTKPNIISVEYIKEKKNSINIDLNQDYIELDYENFVYDTQLIIDKSGIYDLSNLVFETITINAEKVVLELNNSNVGLITSSETCNLVKLNAYNSVIGRCNVNSNLYVKGNLIRFLTDEDFYSIKANKCYFDNAKINIENKQNIGILAEKVMIVDSVVNIDSKLDGISANSSDLGIVYFDNSTYICNTNGDGIKAKNNIIIKESEINITSENIFVKNSSENMQKYNLTSNDFNYSKRDNVYGYKPGIYSDYAIINSSKGLHIVGDYECFDNQSYEKNMNGILIEQSNIYINSTDDCLFSEYGFLVVEDSKLKLNSQADTIRADTIVNIVESIIDIKYCYEGVEAPQVQLFDSQITIHSNDDSIESSSRYNRAGNIIVDGGVIDVKSDNDDGFDAYNYAYVISGDIVAYGSQTQGEGFDCDKGAIFDGGNIIGVSHHTYTDFKENSSQIIIYLNYNPFNNESDMSFSIVDENGDNIVEYDIIMKFGNIVVSTNNLIRNQKYKMIFSNGEEIEFTCSSQVVIIDRSV